MKISKLIEKLEELKSSEGDLNVCISDSDEYWGSVETYLEDYNIKVSEHAQPEGPKSGKSEKAVILSY